MAPPYVRFDHFPVEIVSKVFAELDLEGALVLGKASVRFARVLKENWAFILLPILSREFKPVDALLRIPTVFPNEELGSPYSTWLKRRVRFGGRLVCHGDTASLLTGVNYQREHMARLIRICRVVKQWEAEFPRLRFAQDSSVARSLRAHENERLRGALYNWWRYAIFFHQDPEQTRSWVRCPGLPDIRCKNLRTFSTARLLELQDLWDTIRAAVATELCPSVSVLQQLYEGQMSEDEAARIGWGEDLENDLIVSTVMRLPPDDMLYVLNSGSPFDNKNILIDKIRHLHPSIESGVESLSDALSSVLFQRRENIKEEAALSGVEPKTQLLESSFPKLEGGVLDYSTQAWEELRLEYENDGGTGLADYDPRVGVAYSNVSMPRGLLKPSH